jgi:hypothetical protein
MQTNTKRRLAPKVNHYLFGIMAVTLFMSIILGAQALGIWSTSGKLDSGGKPVQVTGKDPTEIKGWMVLQDLSTAYNIPMAEIYNTFKLPSDTPPNVAIKDLEGKGENFSTTSLKSWIAQKIGVVPPPISTPKGSGEKTKP